MTKPTGDLAIIGSGIAGLTAANYSKNKNKLIFEKGSIGGKTRSETINNFTCDVGAQFLLNKFNFTLKLIEELGLKRKLAEFNQPLISIYRDGQIIPIKPSILGFIRSGPFNFSNKLNFLRMFRKIRDISARYDLSFKRSGLGTRHDHISISDWVLENFEEDLLEYFVQPLLTSITLSEPEELSATYGLTLLSSMEHLYAIRGGFGEIPARIIEKNSLESKIFSNAEVKKIVVENEKVAGVDVSIKGTKKFYPATKIICSVPSKTVLKILKLPVKNRRAFEQIEYSSAIQVCIATKERVWDKTYGIVIPRAEKKMISAIAESTLRNDSYAPKGNGLLSIFIAGKNAKKLLKKKDNVIGEKVIDELEDIFPGIEDKKIFIKTYKWEQGIPIHRPGFSEWVNYLGSPYKNLYFCGDYLYLGSVESAVYSGVEAAKLSDT